MLKAEPVPLTVYGAYQKAEYSLSTGDTARAILRSSWHASKGAAEEMAAQYDRTFVVYVQMLEPDGHKLKHAQELPPTPLRTARGEAVTRLVCTRPGKSRDRPADDRVQQTAEGYSSMAGKESRTAAVHRQRESTHCGPDEGPRKRAAAPTHPTATVHTAT